MLYLNLNMNEFVYLHSYSAYSVLNSGMSVQDYVLALKKLGVKAAGLSDLNFLYGQPQFDKLARQNAIRPLLGLDIVFEDVLLTLYAKDESGYSALINVSSSLGQNANVESILREYKTHLVAITTSNQAFISDHYQDNPTIIRDVLKRLALIFDDFYLGVESYHRDDETASFIRQFAQKYNYQLVAFPHVKYINRQDAINLELAHAIRDDINLEDVKTKNGDHFLYTFEQLNSLYTALEITTTNTIAQSISFTFNEKRGQLLRFPTPDNIDNRLYLKDLCEQAIAQLNIDDKAYLSRMAFELDVIDDMGYNDYFLIVHDYVKYAKSQGILVGPGRGSAAGSLVAYLLDITTIDPLKYDLLFERFLNPARQTMPDIDIDFMDVRRDEVIAYLKQKYGETRVANIVTFQTNAARASIRDIGRIYQIDGKHINLLTKSLGTSLFDLRDAYRNIKSFKSLVDSDPFYLEIVSLSAKIEGFPRQTGMHAAGLILNNEPLVASLPVFNNNGVLMTQYEMAYLEEQGFLKMDILGLTNLTMIDTCLRLIKHYHGVQLDYEKLPFDDEKVYSLIAEGKTMGVFQLESAGMLRAISQIKPTEFNDIVAVLALFRPGPMENIPTYANRKETGARIDYLDEGFKQILDPTYGIIVYQEQIMQIVRHMAGFSYAEADMFRRAISKKDEKKLIKLEKDFLKGASAQGYTISAAKKVFEDIHKFADYGFNKSHSVAYAKLACQMAYLKVYYPLEFYAAILDKATSNDTKFPKIVSEMKQRGIKLLLPSINQSGTAFVPTAKQLRLPLNMIKGISSDKANRFIEERQNNGPFKSLENLLTRAHHFDVSKSDLRLLVEAGALDEFGYSRKTMLQQVENLDFYQNYGLIEENSFLSPMMIEELSDDNSMKISREVELLGIAISDNPIHYVADKFKAYHLTTVSEIDTNNPRIYGYIKALKTIKTKKGDQMAFLTLSDYDMEIEVTLFPSVYAQYFSQLSQNKIIGLTGAYQIRDEKPQIVATQIYSIEEE